MKKQFKPSPLEEEEKEPYDPDYAFLYDLIAENKAFDEKVRQRESTEKPREVRYEDSIKKPDYKEQVNCFLKRYVPSNLNDETAFSLITQKLNDLRSNGNFKLQSFHSFIGHIPKYLSFKGCVESSKKMVDWIKNAKSNDKEQLSSLLDQTNPMFLKFSELLCSFINAPTKKKLVVVFVSAILFRYPVTLSHLCGSCSSLDVSKFLINKKGETITNEFMGELISLSHKFIVGKCELDVINKKECYFLGEGAKVKTLSRLLVYHYGSGCKRKFREIALANRRYPVTLRADYFAFMDCLRGLASRSRFSYF